MRPYYRELHLPVRNGISSKAALFLSGEGTNLPLSLHSPPCHILSDLILSGSVQLHDLCFGDIFIYASFLPRKSQ